MMKPYYRLFFSLFFLVIIHTAWALPQVEFSPPTFPASLNIGTSNSYVYALTNRANHDWPVQINGLSGAVSLDTSPSSNTCQNTLPALGSCFFTLIIAPTSIGTINNLISIGYGSRTPYTTQLNISVANALQSIAITPSNPSLLRGKSQAFTATATYDDGSTADITSAVTWQSSDHTVASISTSGVATSSTTGSTNITATFSGVTSTASTITVNNYVYVANGGAGNVSYCIRNTNGSLTGCQATASGTYNFLQGITINSALTYLYLTDGRNIFICSVESNGNLASCNTTGGGFSFDTPVAVTLNPSNTYAYIAENTAGPNNIISCDVNTSNGELQNCVTNAFSGVQPLGLAVNPADTYLYVVDFNHAFYCPINNTNGKINTCVQTGSFPAFSGPYNIAINPAGTYAYVTLNTGGTGVDYCQINGDASLSGCTGTGSGFGNPTGISIDPTDSYAYVSNYSFSSVSYCTIQGDGSFSTCSTASGFSNPEGNAAP